MAISRSASSNKSIFNAMIALALFSFVVVYLGTIGKVTLSGIDQSIPQMNQYQYAEGNPNLGKSRRARLRNLQMDNVVMQNEEDFKLEENKDTLGAFANPEATAIAEDRVTDDGPAALMKEQRGRSEQAATRSFLQNPSTGPEMETQNTVIISSTHVDFPTIEDKSALPEYNDFLDESGMQINSTTEDGASLTDMHNVSVISVSTVSSRTSEEEALEIETGTLMQLNSNDVPVRRFHLRGRKLSNSQNDSVTISPEVFSTSGEFSGSNPESDRIVSNNTTTTATTEKAKFDEKLSDSLVEFFKAVKAKSVVVLGSRMGQYVTALKNNTEMTVTCYQGLSKDSTDEDCQIEDLNETFQLAPHDWVLYFGLDDSISPKLIRKFLFYVATGSQAGIVISWSPKKLKEKKDRLNSALNKRGSKYLREILKALGFQNDRLAEKQLRNSSTVMELKETIMVFQKLKEEEFE